MKRIQIHPSGLILFNTCAEAFRRRYICGDKRPPAAHLIVGRAADTGIHTDLEEKLKTGTLLPDEAVEAITADIVEREFKEEVDLEGQPVQTKGWARGAAIDRAVSFASYGHRNLNPVISPKALHRKWSVRLDDFFKKRGVAGVKLDYVGEMDIEEYLHDFTDKPGIAIRDIKISRRSPPEDAANAKHFVQLTSYALGKQVEDGVMPQRVQVDYLVDLKKGIEHKPRYAERDQFDLAALFNRLEVFARAFKAGLFPPAPRDHWKCSPKWCGYYGTCPYVRNPKTIHLSVPDPRTNRLIPLPAKKEYDEGE